MSIRWCVTMVTLALAAACGGGEGGAETFTPPDTAADSTTQDADDLDLPNDPGGPMPVCECPTRPSGGTCRSCSTLDDRCEGDRAIHCVISQGCLQTEECDVDGYRDCQSGQCMHMDPGPEPEPDVVETAEPDVVEAIEPGSRQVGEACTDFADCANGMSCIAGQYTMAHCNPMCTSVEDCTTAYPGGNAQCAALSGGSVCIWMCGSFGGGATCPGDLSCDGATCG